MERFALVFPGQGSQFVGMGLDFYENFRESALVFEEASDTIKVNLGKLAFEGPADELTQTENLQPALFTTEAAILAALRAHVDLHPVVVAGHSLGEYSALHAARALSVADGVRLTRIRGGAMQRAVPLGRGTMAAILGLSAEQVKTLCRRAQEKAKLNPANSENQSGGSVVEPANFNAPGQVVIAGTTGGVAQAIDLLKTDEDFKGGKAIPLQVSAPFHCSLMSPAQKEMAPHLATAQFSKPACAVIPNVMASPTDSEYVIPSALTDQITSAVRWEESMTALRNLDVTKVLEIGPGRVLAGLHKRIDRAMPVGNIGTVESMKEIFK
jgi:[acyl-carrier-protein] S-malonyltransferase